MINLLRPKILKRALLLFSLLRLWLPSGANELAGNLVKNPEFRDCPDNRTPANYDLTGNAIYGYMANPEKEFSYRGVALRGFGSGAVSQTITNLDYKAGKQFRFTFRGLPQDNFAVTADDLYIKVEFFGDSSAAPSSPRPPSSPQPEQSPPPPEYDGKIKSIYPEIEQSRRDLAANGFRNAGGAAGWKTYGLDFILPFPQVTQVRLTVGFGHGTSTGSSQTNFLVTGFCLVQLPGSIAPASSPAAGGSPQIGPGTPVPIGGRWFYAATPAEPAIPKVFNESNAATLLYYDGSWSAPFQGNMTAWLRAGMKDESGSIVTEDRFVPDNVTVTFNPTEMVIHTHSVPNHPTGKFPETGFGRNPSYIQEQEADYYVPLNPVENPNHVSTALDNSNHALPMGPIGIAINGVVFFNPFDAGNQDASNLMDRCCGHPNPDNLYHYHKYPICVNSPWSDEGAAPSPIIGWAFDGFPIYGPYESANLMAKDIQGPGALNDFNIHYDAQRGWHYNVTPGKFPYIIGGYWGTEDPRDSQRPRHPPGSAFANGPMGQGGFPPPFGAPP